MTERYVRSHEYTFARFFAELARGEGEVLAMDIFPSQRLGQQPSAPF